METPKTEGGDGTHQKPFSFAGELTSLKTSLGLLLNYIDLLMLYIASTFPYSSFWSRIRA